MNTHRFFNLLMVTAFALLIGLTACQTLAGRTAGDVVDDFTMFSFSPYFSLLRS